MKRKNDEGSQWWRDEYHIAKRETEDRKTVGHSFGAGPVPEELWKKLRAREIENLREGREAAQLRKDFRTMLREAVSRAREEGRDVDEAVTEALERFLARPDSPAPLPRNADRTRTKQ